MIQEENENNDPKEEQGSNNSDSAPQPEKQPEKIPETSPSKEEDFIQESFEKGAGESLHEHDRSREISKGGDSDSPPTEPDVD